MNLFQETVLKSCSPEQKAEFLLESNNLSNETLVVLVFTTLNTSLENLDSFFGSFVAGAAKRNLTALSVDVRDRLLNLTLTALVPQFNLLNDEGVQRWSQVYLPLLLPSANSQTFQVIPRNITCSSYQHIVKGFDNIISQLSGEQTQLVFNFSLDYLTGQLSSGLSCVDAGNVTDDRRWLEVNFGQFRFQASFMDFLTFKVNFKGVEVADLLSFTQLSQLAAIPSQLNGTQDVMKIMTFINASDFSRFFDLLEFEIKTRSTNHTQEVKSAFLQAVFDRGGLTAASDEEVLLWLRVRLRPLLVDLSPALVTSLAKLGEGRRCNTTEEMIKLLNSLQTTFSSNTKAEIFGNIVRFLQGPTPLKCYSGGSFYLFLKNTFLSFGFPDVSTLISLLPPTRKSELLNSFNASELSQFLSGPGAIGNGSDVCALFSLYNHTAAFLETEDVPDDVRRAILPCVWPLALSSSSRSEVNFWFDLRLKNYLRFLTPDLISATAVQNASCLAFEKLVSVMGNNFTYNSSEFGREDVYSSIRSYLSAGSGVRCYDPRDPELNSTSWFFNYIGSFITFITLDDLTSFVNTTQIEVFLEDQFNLDLFSNVAIPSNVTSFYIKQVFTFNPTFSPLRFPGIFLCSSDVPSTSYSSLDENNTVIILDRLGLFCNGTNNPEIAATLASNIKTLTLEIFRALGKASSGLSISQITSVSPSVLLSALSTLSSVTDWAQDQARTIIERLLISDFKIDSAAALKSLGSIVTGLASEFLDKIDPADLFSIATSSDFISNILSAPKILQLTFVNKIISLFKDPLTLLLSVPNRLASAIPPSLLALPEGSVDIKIINAMLWTPDQAVLVFKNLAATVFEADLLSPFVLQGFTCTSVQKMTPDKVTGLIRAVRPRLGLPKVVLKESQLTCMYNLVRNSLTENFLDYPSDMLLFFETQNIQKDRCRSYFSALGAADFSVASGILRKGPQLFTEATTCLGLTGLSLSRDAVEVLGNMVCTLDRSYIENSDPFILEKLKACKDLSDGQVAAVETLLLSGETVYGNSMSWSEQTLESLGTLPLHLSRNVWGRFQTTAKRNFLKTFMPNLRKLKTQKIKLKNLFRQIIPIVAKRAAGCTEGNISQVIISDPAFPFGYDETQFDLCLDIPVLRDNLNTICQKVDDDEFQKVILKKLSLAYPSGVPDQAVQMLGSVSRVATLEDISKWSITKVDTLSALFSADDGSWETEKSKEIIEQYLRTSGNSLGPTELTIIGSNLCSLNASRLKTISPLSILTAQPANVASCSTEQKTVLYETSSNAFLVYRPSFIDYYNLMKPYLGGAPLGDVVFLSTQNINMDVDVFRSLQLDVIRNLTVRNVQLLMGDQLRDLKLFENDTVVRTWANLQFQSDLDTLGIGLISNRTEPTTVAPIQATTAAAAFPQPSVFLAALLPAVLLQRRA
ncbi:uncharacterized protein LOC105939733 [Fundulus heteroclitus]|uniref:uncharacterized protein LOC105939733 n=1 Tax=Fundulus heteroclitus TaxID=8078 RepID=UPI00165B9375|nr:uncharacterized protein LOC105939733 [Fundulus heteroclitus]